MAKWWLFFSVFGIAFLSKAQTDTTALGTSAESLQFATDSLPAFSESGNFADSSGVIATDTIPIISHAPDSLLPAKMPEPEISGMKKPLFIGDPTDSLAIVVDAPLMFDTLTFGLETFEVIDSLMAADSLMNIAQDSAAKAVRNAPPPPPFIRDIGIFYDYGKLIGFLVDFEQKHEAGIRIVFGNNYFIGAEYGTAVITPMNAYRNASYKVEGAYLRVGGGLMGELSAKSNIGLGLYYGMSEFRDEGRPLLDSPSGLHGITEGAFARENLSANWAEFSFITETRMYPNIYFGMHIRFKIMISYDQQTPLDVYTIPGYGRTFDNTLPAINLFVRYKLPF